MDQICQLLFFQSSSTGYSSSLSCLYVGRHAVVGRVFLDQRNTLGAGQLVSNSDALPKAPGVPRLLVWLPAIISTHTLPRGRPLAIVQQLRMSSMEVNGYQCSVKQVLTCASETTSMSPSTWHATRKSPWRWTRPSRL